MTKNRRYGEHRSFFSRFSFVLIGVFVLLGIWLITSLVKKENPISLVSNLFSSSASAQDEIPDDATTIQLKQTIRKQQDVIDSLKNRLDILDGVDNFIRAKVDIESSHLNMRKSPSLSSPLITKIANNEEVHVVEYDAETYVLDGQTGKWCKIVHHGQTGWVWGNYIRQIEE